MASFYGIDTDKANDFFGSYALQSSQGGGSLTSSLGDYALIKSGAYKKLLNSYYKKTDSTQKADSEEVKKEKNNLVTAKSDADKLNAAAKKLMETEFTEDNRDTIKENVKSFVDSYNSLVTSGSEVDNKNVLRNTLWMTQATNSMNKLFSEIGVSVGDGNKLTLDESKLDSAKLTTLKTLFTGSFSYMDKIAQKTAAISNGAAAAAAEGRSASAYTNSGKSYDQITTSVLYDSLT